ncbi:MAG: hypothetical protein ACD_58C00082G0003, partial [uncultured bacterium]
MFNGRNVLIGIIVILILTIAHLIDLKLDNQGSQPKPTVSKDYHSIFTSKYTQDEKDYFNNEINRHQWVVLSRMSSYYWYKTVRAYRQTFERECKEHNVPFLQAFSHGYMENSGGIDKGSPAGCVGIMQLNVYNARVAGLVVNSKVDQRKDPYKCIHGGVVYL